MLQRSLIVAFGVLLAVAEVRAACPPNVIPGALSARVDAKGLDIAQGMLLNMVPSEIPIPEESHTLFTCPTGFDDTVFTPQGAAVQVNVRSARVSLHDGAIELDMDLDVGAGMALDMVLCAAPDATCDAAIDVPGITVHARLEPSITTCSPQLPISELDIGIDPYAAVVQLSSCGLYDDLWQLTYDWFREFIINLVVEKVEEIAVELLPGFMETFTNDMLRDGFEIQGMRFDVAPEAIILRPDGLTLHAAANVLPLNAPADCLPQGAALPPELAGAPMANLGTSAVSVATSRNFMQRAVRSAWLNGLLCFDSDALGLDFGGVLDPLAPGATLGATVALHTPPILQLGTVESPTAIRIAAQEIQVNVDVRVPGEEPADVVVTAGLGVAAEVGLDPQANALTLALVGVDSSGVQVDMSALHLAFSPETIGNVVQNVVLPSFATSTDPLPLTGGLFVMSPLALQLEGVHVDANHVRADLDLWPVDIDDHVPPHTVVAMAPMDPSPADVIVELASVDDRTPDHFLRHWLEVDGVLEDTPRPGTTLTVAGLSGGVHHVAVRAMDLNDNLDPSPVELAVFVDAVAPVVTFTEEPLGVVEEDRVRVAYVGVDDHTPGNDLRWRYTLSIVDKRGDTDIPLLGDELGTLRELTLDQLPEDEILRLTLYAADEAGNEGSAQSVFAVNADPTLGCAATPAPWLALGPLLFALIVRRRR